MHLPVAGLDKVLQSNEQQYPANDLTASAQFIRAASASAVTSRRSHRASRPASSTTTAILVKTYGTAMGDASKLSSAYYGNADHQLPELLYNLASVAYLFADSYLANDDGAPPVITRPGTRLPNNWNPERAAFGYMQGRRALEGIVSLHSSKPENKGALVEARFALADWHEAFGYYKRAEQQRKHAVDLSATLSPEEYNNRVTSRSPSPWQVSARELVTDVSLSMKW